MTQHYESACTPAVAHFLSKINSTVKFFFRRLIFDISDVKSKAPSSGTIMIFLVVSLLVLGILWVVDCAVIAVLGPSVTTTALSSPNPSISSTSPLSLLYTASRFSVLRLPLSKVLLVLAPGRGSV